MEGPSVVSFEGFGNKSRDGFTTSRDTRARNITAGERYENNVSNTAVKDRIGAR